MRRVFLNLILAFGTLLTISACGGGGGSGGSVAPIELDYTGVTGTGAGGDPYVLPSENQDGVTQGIEDYLNNSGYTSWKVNIDGLVQTAIFGSADISGELVYDANRRTWIINVNGEDYDYRQPYFDGHYYSIYSYDGLCKYDHITNCGTFWPYYFRDEDYGESKYGTFAKVWFEDPDNYVMAYVHFGLKTPDGGMPTSGTGSYSGYFNGTVNFDDPDALYGIVGGAAEVAVNFGTGAVSFSSTRANGDWEYSVSGDATITGNTYEGTMFASYEDVDGNSLTVTSDNGTLSGAFYGPNAEETAGIVSGTGDGGELVGGFWAAK